MPAPPPTPQHSPAEPTHRSPASFQQDVPGQGTESLRRKRGWSDQTGEKDKSVFKYTVSLGVGRGGVSPHPHSYWIWRWSRKIGFRAPEPTRGGTWEEESDKGSSQVLRHPTSPWPSRASSRPLPSLALTLSACSLCTFLFASMSHLFPRRRRSTPADAFWEQKGKTSKAGSCSSSQCPSCSRSCPHLFDALHPVLNILKGFLICDVVYQDDALGMGVHRGPWDPRPL